MNDNEILKTIENLAWLLEKYDNIDNLKCEFKRALKRALSQPYGISATKLENSTITKVHLNGERLALICGIATLESDLLKQLHCSEEEFNFIKQFIGTEEVSYE